MLNHMLKGKANNQQGQNRAVFICLFLKFSYFREDLFLFELINNR